MRKSPRTRMERPHQCDRASRILDYDANGQALGYFSDEPHRRSAISWLTRDEARWMAALWKMTPISIESRRCRRKRSMRCWRRPQRARRNRNQQTIVSFSVR